MGVDGIVAVFYSSFRHLMLIDFVTRKAAHKVSIGTSTFMWLPE